MSLVGAIVPTMPLNPGLNWSWLWRTFGYRQFGSETISVVALVSGKPSIYTCSPEVAKQVLSGSDSYIKHPESMVALLLWGDNVISSNYEDYKRHRRIVGPSFSTDTYNLVWKETIRTYKEMVDTEGWATKTSFTVPAVNKYMTKFTLSIISMCGFGLPIRWQEQTESANLEGETPFGEALSTVCEGVITRLATPSWMYKLPIQALHDVDKAYRDLGKFMRGVISDRKEEIGADTLDSMQARKNDLFTSLVRANEGEGKLGLSDQEMIGNLFSFMFAGHETTAHVLSATLSLLALHPAEQEIVSAQIREVLPDSAEPVFDDLNKLDKVWACFQEAARLFPAGAIVTRDTTEPVTLLLDEGQSSPKTLHLPAGIRIVVDMIGIHYNPRIYENPEQFKPSRWYGKADSDSTFFGFGPRACLGRKFAQTEATCLLALILRDWKVEPVFLEGETTEKWRDRIMQGSMVGLGFGIRSSPLRFNKRV